MRGRRKAAAVSYCLGDYPGCRLRTATEDRGLLSLNLLPGRGVRLAYEQTWPVGGC